MRPSQRVVVPMVICSVLLFASAGEKSTAKIEPVQTWAGMNLDSDLIREGPRMEFVSDPDSWRILWSLWTRDADVPAVDFEKHIVILGAMLGPNKVDLLPAHVVDGDLRFVPSGTLKGGRGFGYKFQVINRAGIKSVNGIPIQGCGYSNVTIVGVFKTNVLVDDGESNSPTITSRGITWRSACKADPLRGSYRRGKWTHRSGVAMLEAFGL